MATDKPTVNSTWAEIDKAAREIAPGPFTASLPGNKRITFPDPTLMDWLEMEAFFADMTTATNATALRRWLSAEDFKKLEETKPLTSGHIIALLGFVQKHYASMRDILGEASASQG